MNFPSIEIQGSVISAELLGKIRAEQATWQQGKDFNKDFTNAKLKDEISLAWQDAKGQWTIFNNKLKRVAAGESAATETRSFWILPLLSNLGYDFQYLKQAEEINGKSFWINNRDNNIGGFPLFIAGYNESLDKRPENKNLRVSPHALVQEYLNYSEHLYGLVTNGKQLRMLRDASRLTRLSYVEFNLEKIMEEDLYSDFVILYRLLHKSRMPLQQDAGSESIIEKYHVEGLEAGATIRNKLGEAVKGNPKSNKKGAIELLANAFINHPENIELRNAVATGNFNADEFYRQQLRIIYRLLFLFVIEERNLVYAESKDPQTKRFNEIYFKHYSLLRLRKLAKRLSPPEAARHYDLWMSLVSTFSLFEDKLIGEKLSIMSLQGDLFSYNAIANNRYDLHQCRLSNAVLLQVIKALGYFENEKGLPIAVNYGGLDVEEFGSVYEGLLELKLDIKPIAGSSNYSCTFDTSTERSSSGSHYTPEELVQPLIKHSLDYIIEDRLKTKDAVKALLEIKVCDVACGSGHILLSAARKIAIAIARVQTNEEQPNPKAIRKAMRDVIRHCIYGVDKNPLAVELCKVAFWLEAHNPGEPLNFLDHHIKCGDAIVGLAHKEELENGIADEAFKTLPGDEKEIATAFAKRNKAERKTRGQATLDFEVAVNQKLENVLDAFKLFDLLPENTPDEIEAKAAAYNRLLHSGALQRLKTLADIQVGQFFIAKKDANKDKLVTDASYFRYLKAEKPIPATVTTEMIFLQPKQKFFHWFLEFPEVFQQGGFDCILGNPPFLGGKRISTHYGDNFNNYLFFNYHPHGGITDLVAYFFRRVFAIINNNGFSGLISTNTISQGDTRIGGLEYIVKNSGQMLYANKSVRWPGQAAVFVSLVCFSKRVTLKPKFLINKKVDFINSYLDNTIDNSPLKLKANESIAFIGSYVLGEGFILNESEMKSIVASNSSNIDVILPYLNGSDLNSSPKQKPSRFVIDFKNWDEEKAKLYDACYERIFNTVKFERQDKKEEKLRRLWWQFARRADDLYKQIEGKEKVICIAQVSKTGAFSIVDNDKVFDSKLIVFNLNDSISFNILQSTMHIEWAWKYGTTMKTDLSYGPQAIFETFPFPQNLSSETEQKLEQIGEQYHEHRRQLMLLMQLGLTKTYNLFHTKELTIAQVAKASKQDEATAQKAYNDILKLRALHKQMDEAVLAAYGWQDVALQHDFYEVDYLPENDRIRYTIHPDVRKEILKRLLELNHKIHEEEVAAGLWDKKKTYKKTTTTNEVNEPSAQYGLELEE